MSADSKSIIGTAIVILAAQSDPMVVALKAEASELEDKIASIPFHLPSPW